MVWFWQQAEDGAGRARGVLKAFAWPAFLVYGAFKALEEAAESSPSSGS
jgi:hypothetical protein